MINYKSVVSSLLRDYADKVDSNECELSKDDTLNLVSNIAHITLSKKEVADRYNVSEKTIDRREASGILPESHIKMQSKKQWYLDELIKNEQ